MDRSIDRLRPGEGDYEGIVKGEVIEMVEGLKALAGQIGLNPKV